MLNLIVKVKVIYLVIGAGIFLSLIGMAFAGQEEQDRIGQELN